MAVCNSYGKSKVKHESKALARMHAMKLNKTRIYRSEAYRCPKCRYWHAGRIPRTVEMKRLQRSVDKRDDMLVGKLIGALKVVMNRSGRV